MRREEAAKLVAVCLAMWTNHAEKVNPDALITGWSLALSDIDYAEGEAALTEYLQTGTFFPAPAEIRKLVKAGQPKLDAKLYGRYAILRRQYQTALLSGHESAELDHIEGKLGIPQTTRQHDHELGVGAA